MGAKVGVGTIHPSAALHIKGSDPDLFLDIDGSSGNQLTELRFGSNGVIHSNIYWSKATGKTYIQNEGTKTIVIDQHKAGLGTDQPATTLHIATGSDVDLSDTAGYLVLGSVSGYNVAFDDNEIQARSNRSPATLHLQHEGGDLIVHPSGTSRFIIQNSGAVGIDTNAPAEKLDVRGNIKLGASGNLFAPGGLDNLRILAGRVNSAGVAVLGSGFSSSRSAAGHYSVTFASTFSSAPVVVASQADHDDNVVSVWGISVSGFQVRSKDMAGGDEADYQDRAFTFIAMGGR